jgi:PKD repeat protein
VTDDDGAIDSTTQSVSVTAANVPPTASFTFVATDLNAAFTDASTDGDGTVDQWSWDFGDGSNSTLQNPTHAYAAAGIYNVELTVTDDDAATDSTTQSVTVTAANEPPTAHFTYIAIVLNAAFTDTSTDGDGTVDQWSWDFGDGNNSTQLNPTHAYTAAGTNSVFLTVTDDEGATDNTTRSVTVADTPNVNVIYVSSFTGALLAASVSQMRISWPTTPSADSGQCILTARMWD